MSNYNTSRLQGLDNRGRSEAYWRNSAREAGYTPEMYNYAQQQWAEMPEQGRGALASMDNNSMNYFRSFQPSTWATKMQQAGMNPGQIPTSQPQLASGVDWNSPDAAQSLDPAWQPSGYSDQGATQDPSMNTPFRANPGGQMQTQVMPGGSPLAGLTQQAPDRNAEMMRHIAEGTAAGQDMSWLRDQMGQVRQGQAAQGQGVNNNPVATQAQARSAMVGGGLTAGMSGMGQGAQGQAGSPTQTGGMMGFPGQGAQGQAAQGQGVNTAPQAARQSSTPWGRGQTGLKGAEQAMMAGTNNANRAIRNTGQQAAQTLRAGLGGRRTGDYYNTSRTDLNNAASQMRPYTVGGADAREQMANLTGANGSEAQQQAYDDFNESPGQAWLRERGERAVLRNAAATGGLGGGRVLQELQRQGMGLAQQDFQNHYQRLSDLSGAGQKAADSIAGIRNTGANLSTQMASGRMNNETGIRSALADTYQNQGQSIANNNMSRGNVLAGLRTDAGNNLAQGRMQTGNNLADLMNQGGLSIADMAGQGANNLGNFLGGIADSQAQGWGAIGSGIAGVNQGLIGGLGSTTGMQNPQQVEGKIDEFGQLLGGLGSLGGFLFSDRRLKKAIKQIGSMRGHSIYEWEWTPEALALVGDQPSVGVMADEVPAEYVVTGPHGYQMVNYGGLLYA